MYQKCTDLLDTATRIKSDNSEVIATQASVAYGKHLFGIGLAYIEKAIQLNPKRVAYYGLQGDGNEVGVAGFDKPRIDQLLGIL